MIRTIAVVTTSTVALLVPVGGADASLPGAERGTSVAGTWKGAVYGDNGAAAGYTAKVRLTRNDRGRWVGRITYPGTCSGRWAYKGRGGGWTRFRERITRDPAGGLTCVSPVAVKVRRDGARLRVRWTEPRSGDTGTMLARRV